MIESAKKCHHSSDALCNTALKEGWTSMKNGISKLIWVASAALLLLPLRPTLAAGPTIGNCNVFPADNPWNTDISGATVASNSTAIINNILAHGGDFVHPDFGSYFGIPYITVNGATQKVKVQFVEYGDESDPGPYPIPTNPPIEGGGDAHMLVVDDNNCVLYELYHAHRSSTTGFTWDAGSGAIFNLNSNALRPADWTSADAAGLPIFPGLARCDEAMSGSINHALRFTVSHSRNTYVYPATHAAGTSDTSAPPMGMRFRLKSNPTINTMIAGFPPQSKAVATALQKYGMILADNGSNWFISGEPSSCWDNEDLNSLKAIPGDQFEVIVSPPPATVTLPTPTLHTPVDNDNNVPTQPVLDWNPVVGVAKYKIKFGQVNPPVQTIATVDATNYTQVSPGKLLPGFTYYWQVQGLDSGNNPITPPSQIRSFVVGSPANAAPDRNLYTALPVKLTWDRLSWASGYQIQISSTTNFTGVPIQDFDANTFSYSIPAPLSNGYHYWHVRGVKADGTPGTWSATESILVNVPG